MNAISSLGDFASEWPQATGLASPSYPTISTQAGRGHLLMLQIGHELLL
jgi:hypothetical protein